MRVQKTTFHKSAHAFNILGDNDEIITRVEDERTARLFVAAPEMKALLKAILDRPDVYIRDDETCRYCDDDTPVEHSARDCPAVKARALLAQLSKGC